MPKFDGRAVPDASLAGHAERRAIRPRLFIGVVLGVWLACAGARAGADVTCGAATGHSCGGSTSDPASAGPPDGPATSVGNPIDLVTGNKHQREVDYRAPGSALEVVRHYNSANADHERGTGQGWSGSYDARLYRSADGFEILQSDGRRVRFTVPDEDAEGRPVMRATSPSDGVFREGRPHVWRLPDGRALSFHGTYLVRIDWPGARFLQLGYRGPRLASATDHAGRSLFYTWTPGAVGLDGYDPVDFTSSAGRLASVALPDGSSIGYDYDNLGNLTRVRYPDGTHRRYHYEDAVWRNHLTGITDRTGRRLSSWGYDDDGRAASSERADGEERVLLEHAPPTGADGVGSTTITNAHGARSVYRWRRDPSSGRSLLLSGEGTGCTSCPPTGLTHAWTAEGLWSGVTDGSGLARTHERDARGRLTETWESAPRLPARRVLRRSHSDADDRLDVVARPSVNPDGEHVVRTVRDRRGLPTSIVETGFAPAGPVATDGFVPIERTTRFEHDDAGLLVAVDGPREDVDDIVRFRHDDDRRVAGVDWPGGRSIDVLERDGHGRATAFRMGTASPLRIGFDANGHVASIERGGRTVTYEHDAEGRLLGATDADGRSIAFSLDDAARPIGVTDDLGRRTTLERDAAGRVTGTAFAGIDGTTVRSARYVRDALGRLSRLVRAEGETSQTLNIGHDAADRIAWIMDVESGARAELVHDAFAGTTLAVPVGAERAATTTLHRDAAGRPSGSSDSRGNRTVELRDDFGRLVIEASPDRGVTRHVHDAAGNRVRREDAAGNVTRWIWDAANRPTLRTTPDGSTRYAYDAATGRLAEIANADVRETFEYDGEARLTAHARYIDGRTFVTRYAHDDAGRLLRKVLPDGQSLRYHYHVDGSLRGTLRAITRESFLGLRQEALVAEIDTDARDGASGHLAHNGLRTQRRFHPDGRPRMVQTVDALRLEYEFDEAGRIVGIVDGGTRHRYAYRAGRLIGADTSLGRFAYRYDSSGNRTATRAIDALGATSERHHGYPARGDGNRLLASTAVQGDGEVDRARFTETGLPLNAAGGLSFDYNADGRPVRVHEGGDLLAEYAYNGFGERVRKVVHRADGRRVTYFLHDGSRLSTRIDGDIGAMRHTLRIEDRPVLHLVGDRPHAVHTDHLGTPRVVTDPDGEIVWRAEYTPFGEARIDVEALDFEHRLPGQYRDAETGIHHNYLRDYDPATGRYLTPDPIGLAGGQNAYVYAANDPLRQRDVLGLKPTAEFGESGGDWLIGPEQYARLSILFDAEDDAGYYDYLYELTGHPIYDEFAESLRPLEDQTHVTDVSPVLELLRLLGDVGGFSKIERIGCSPDGRPIYAIPDVEGLLEGAFQAAGLQLGASRWVESTLISTLRFGADLVGWGVDLSGLGLLGDLLQDLYPESEIPSWVPSFDEGIETTDFALSVAEAIARDASLIWDAIVDPVVADWAEGRYGQVVAGVGLEIATLPLGVIKAGKVASIAGVFTALKRADAVAPGEFVKGARLAAAEARRDGVPLDRLTDAAREAGVLDDLLASGTLRQGELDELVAAGKLSSEEAARAVPAAMPPFRDDFEQHTLRGHPDPVTGGYQIAKDGSISGAHNSDEFAIALANPRGDGVAGEIVDSTAIRDSSGQVVGAQILYRVPRVHGNGPDAGKSVVDPQGNVLYRQERSKTVYLPEQVSDAKMLQSLEVAGTRVYDTHKLSIEGQPNKTLQESYIVDGVRYRVYLRTDPSGVVLIDNVHIQSW